MIMNLLLVSLALNIILWILGGMAISEKVDRDDPQRRLKLVLVYLQWPALVGQVLFMTEKKKRKLLEEWERDKDR